MTPHSFRSNFSELFSSMFYAVSFLLPVIVSSIVVASVSVSALDSSGSSLPLHQQQACVYENHLVTDKNWYGFLANISVASTGRLTFEFAYPAEKCCQNILFYSDDQISIINARMNCWQKEYPLRPDEDILRLTPRFSWSGCHVTHPNNVPTYVCKGGRSFTVDHTGGGGRSAGGGGVGNHGAHGYHHHHGRRGDFGASSADVGAPSANRLGSDRPATWYIAVGNCASLHGLDLQYRIEVFGHVGECRSAAQFDHSSSHHGAVQQGILPSPRPVVSRTADLAIAVAGDEGTAAVSGCVIEDDVNTTETWYGFIANISLKADGRIAYRIVLPLNKHVVNVILYTEDDLPKLVVEKHCWGKQGVVTAPNDQQQIIELSARASSNGCSSKDTPAGRMITCQHERSFSTASRVYIAVSNCRAHQVGGLSFSYRFEVFNYEQTDSCSQSSPPVITALSSVRVTLAIVLASLLTQLMTSVFDV